MSTPVMFAGWIERPVSDEAVIRAAGVTDMPGRKITHRPYFRTGIFENCAIFGEEAFLKAYLELGFAPNVFTQVVGGFCRPRDHQWQWYMPSGK